MNAMNFGQVELKIFVLLFILFYILFIFGVKNFRLLKQQLQFARKSPTIDKFTQF